MGRKKRFQADQKAELRGGKFIGLPTVVHKHPSYSKLPAFERAVLLEFIATFNGYNNGKLVLSQRQLADRLNTSNFRRIGKAIARLIEHGLLDISTESVWKQRRAREYRLTFISTGSPPNVRPATNDYLKWKYDTDPVSAETPPFAEPVSAERKSSAEALSAEKAEKAQECVATANFAAEPVSSLISKPCLAAEKARSLTPNLSPETRRADLATLRHRVVDHLNSSEPGEQSRIADRTGIPGGTLSKFLNGSNLPEQYRAPLSAAVTF